VHQVLVAIECPWLLIGWVLWLAAFIWFSKEQIWKQQIFWAEMTCFAITFSLCFVQ
jgi:hypothetical protein